MLGDIRFPFLADPSQREMYYEMFEPEVASAIHSLLPRGGCFFDVGANVGYFTAIAATVGGPGGKYYAFEPHAGHFTRLQMLSRMNEPAYSITCERAAVMDRDGTVKLYESVCPGRHSTQAERVGTDGLVRQKEVPGVCLDSFADRHRIDRIDLLKIDVEGAELEVLRGARMLISEGRIGGIIVELFHPGLEVMPPLVCELESFGFDVVDAISGRPPTASTAPTTSNAICRPG
jgi:FkbM family methyltransferase